MYKYHETTTALELDHLVRDKGNIQSYEMERTVWIKGGRASKGWKLSWDLRKFFGCRHLWKTERKYRDGGWKPEWAKNIEM